ncbi:hypothetical protein AAVH_10318 [Aphelenchoides avenae]|nr:hypothetical protein AAVH_10318 [Aphelenchus avenae]
MMFEAVVAGFCASSSGVALRLAFADETTPTSKILLLGLFAALTASMWFFHVRAMQRASSTAQAVVVNTGTNFVCSGVFGSVFFAEPRSFQWCAGVACILLGISLIHDRPQKEEKEKTT